MIYLDFDASQFPQRAQDDRATDGGRWDAFRFVPVLLRIAGIDLIGRSTETDGAPVSRGLGLPLPEVALWGLAALHHVARNGRSAYDLNEHGAALLFKLNGDTLLVHSQWRGKTVQVPHAALLAAWEEFDRRVRQFLIETFGNLSDYPWWNPTMDAWLHGRLAVARMDAPAAAMMNFNYNEDYFALVDAVD